MPYISSKKTDGISMSRETIDEAVDELAEVAAERIVNNLSVIPVYTHIFEETSYRLKLFLEKRISVGLSTFTRTLETDKLAYAIFEVSEVQNYEGAFLGHFNYAITRFIQRVPQIKVARGQWDKEFSYWYYAATIEALRFGARFSDDLKIGISGVYEDIKDEYKRRVNTAYEAEQIIKSGDCYDTPYYTKLVEVVNEAGEHIGYQEVMLKRSDDTVNVDHLVGKFVLQK